ncbi:MAG: cell division protein FtsQ, partial [Brevundimonas sp.]
MPAVVRGGRRQSAVSSRGAAPKKGGRSRGGAPKPASAIPGKMAAIGRIDVSPRTVMIALSA